MKNDKFQKGMCVGICMVGGLMSSLLGTYWILFTNGRLYTDNVVDM